MSSNSIAIHLPDGAVREVPAGTTPLEIANSISPRLAAAAVVARLTPLAANSPGNSPSDAKPAEGHSSEASMYAAENSAAPRLVDLSTPLAEDTRLELVTEKDPEALKVVRHSGAHVLATAVLELFPETKLGHGPATDSGFFYDFYREKPFTEADLAAIEAKMAEVVARDEKFVREYEPRETGARRIRERRRLHEDPLRDPVHGARVAGELLPQREVCRLLPRTARPLDGPRQGGQDHQPRRSLLAWRREESAVAAHLRHRVLFEKRPRRALRPPRRSRQAATTACWASNSTCSASRNSPEPASSSGTPRAPWCAR